MKIPTDALRWVFEQGKPFCLFTLEEEEFWAVFPKFHSVFEEEFRRFLFQKVYEGVEMAGESEPEWEIPELKTNRQFNRDEMSPNFSKYNFMMVIKF